MCDRFLKLNLDNDEADYLAAKHPNAFILLYFIAKRARRIHGKSDGINIGEAHIGDWETMGLSRQNYRTALKVLCVKKFVQILETNRTRKKSTTGSTTEGTKVKILNSVIWDINSEGPNHQSNHCLTTDQPLPNHEEERKRRSISNDIDNKEEAQPAARPRSKDSLSFDFEIWQFVGITDIDRFNWQALYSHISIDTEITKAQEWLKSNPSKSNKSLWRKFLTGWLQRSNEKIENRKAYSYAGNANSTDRRTKDINGIPVENAYAGMF